MKTRSIGAMYDKINNLIWFRA